MGGLKERWRSCTCLVVILWLINFSLDDISNLLKSFSRGDEMIPVWFCLLENHSVCFPVNAALPLVSRAGEQRSHSSFLWLSFRQPKEREAIRSVQIQPGSQGRLPCGDHSDTQYSGGTAEFPLNCGSVYRSSCPMGTCESLSGSQDPTWIDCQELTDQS